MKKLLPILLLCCISQSTSAQLFWDSQHKNLGLLEKALASAKTAEEKINALIELYIYHSSHNKPENKKAAMEYERQVEVFAYQTGNPELIAKTLRQLKITRGNEEFKKSRERLYEYAKLKNLPAYKAIAKLGEGDYYLNFRQDYNKANQLTNEGLSFAKEVNDSLKAVIYLDAAGNYSTLNNHLQAVQMVYQAHQIASEKKYEQLLAVCYHVLGSIYRRMNDHIKAVDFKSKYLALTKQLNQPYREAWIHVDLARSYFLSEQPLLGNFHLSEAYRLADSTKGSPRLYNNITGTAVSALSISNNDEILKEFLNNYRQHFFIFPGNEFIDYVTLARAFNKIGNLDSARFLIKKATEIFSESHNANIRKTYFFTLGSISEKDGNYALAKESFANALQIATAQKNIPDCLQFTDSLKNISLLQNDSRSAVYYYSLKDSLRTEMATQLDKEELTRQEVAALAKQREIQALEIENQKKQRHNLQYLAITTSVVALFIALLLMGIFNVSVNTIRVLNFFTFLLFFEFVFLVFKKQIYVFTDGEPWKDLAFMVLLAAVMVPLHHWGEHKVIKYLSHKNLRMRKMQFWKKRKIAESEIAN